MDNKNTNESHFIVSVPRMDPLISVIDMWQEFPYWSFKLWRVSHRSVLFDLSTNNDIEL